MVQFSNTVSSQKLEFRKFLYKLSFYLDAISVPKECLLTSPSKSVRLSACSNVRMVARILMAFDTGEFYWNLWPGVESPTSRSIMWGILHADVITRLDGRHTLRLLTWDNSDMTDSIRRSQRSNIGQALPPPHKNCACIHFIICFFNCLYFFVLTLRLSFLVCFTVPVWVHTA